MACQFILAPDTRIFRMILFDGKRYPSPGSNGFLKLVHLSFSILHNFESKYISAKIVVASNFFH